MSTKSRTRSQTRLSRSLGIALRRRPVQPEQVEQMVSRIVRQLESLGETEIHSSTVGDFIMKALKSVDGVAYVRYASGCKGVRATGGGGVVRKQGGDLGARFLQLARYRPHFDKF